MKRKTDDTAGEYNAADYAKYFIPQENGDVLVDTEIFEHRKKLGNKIWNLLRLFTGAGNNDDIKEFAQVPDDTYLARKQFDVVRDAMFDKLVKRDGAFCQICQTTFDLTVDHVIPLSRGGSNGIENMRILCRSHNSSKGAR